MPQLETLRLSWCHLEDGAAISAVADLLSFNGSLREVDLRGNRFGDDGAPLCLLWTHRLPWEQTLMPVRLHASCFKTCCLTSVLALLNAHT